VSWKGVDCDNSNKRKRVPDAPQPSIHVIETLDVDGDIQQLYLRENVIWAEKYETEITAKGKAIVVKQDRSAPIEQDAASEFHFPERMRVKYQIRRLVKRGPGLLYLQSGVLAAVGKTEIVIHAPCEGHNLNNGVVLPFGTTCDSLHIKISGAGCVTTEKGVIDCNEARVRITNGGFLDALHINETATIDADGQGSRVSFSVSKWARLGTAVTLKSSNSAQVTMTPDTSSVPPV